MTHRVIVVQDRLLLFNRIFCLRPFSPATPEGLCIEAFSDQLFRHTGARAFVVSGAVEDYLPVLRQGGSPGIDSLRIHTYGPGNLLVAHSPVTSSPHVDQNYTG